jgi:mannose-6-phosphate isomerase-like protein (cupin superfamily)
MHPYDHAARRASDAWGRVSCERGKEDQVPAIVRKFRDVTWEKIGTFFDIDDEAMPGLSSLKEIQVSMLFDRGQCKHFGSAFEKWPPVTFTWHYECDEIFYVISGGPLRVTHNQEVLEAAAGDVFLFTRGTDVTFEVKSELIGLSIHYPAFEEILKRYKEYAETRQE